MTGKKALILVDLQNDFCTGGALAVADGEKVVPLANQLQPLFELVIATQDWHPTNHVSFADNHAEAKVGDTKKVGHVEQLLWPRHCEQGTKGADFHAQLNTRGIKKIIHKGTNSSIDSYSAFFDNAHQRATGLHDYLQQEKVRTVYVMGLATDYCVKYSVLDALQLGYETIVITDACKGVELQVGDSRAAFDEMQKAGAKLIESATLIKSSS